MRQVDIDEFDKARATGAVCFDTRPKSAHDDDGLPGTRHLDLTDVQAGRLPDVPKDEPIYLICERGQSSELAGLYLEVAGFREVNNVKGGMIAWRKKGLSRQRPEHG